MPTDRTPGRSLLLSWRRANDMWKESIEHERGLVGEVLEILLEITVEDREEAYVVVLKRHPMGEMQRPNGIRRLCPFSPIKAFDQLQGKGLQT